ncbi:hypothetical protein ACFX13_046863 [Malus domestica]
MKKSFQLRIMASKEGKALSSKAAYSHNSLQVIPIILILMLVSSTSIATAGQEAEALLNWKASIDNNTSFSLLSSWIGNSICNWEGIACNNFGSITQINLTSSGLRGINNLTGSIPEAIENLSSLTFLALAFNNFSCAIPSTIGNLTSLKVLYLNANQLSGSIPPEVGKLKFITDLGLVDNKLNGSLPLEMNNFTFLKELWMSNNNFSGSIPQDMHRHST